MDYRQLKRRVISCLLEVRVASLHRSDTGKGFAIVDLDSPVIPAIALHNKKPMKGCVLIKPCGFGSDEEIEAIHYRSVLTMNGFDAVILKLPIPAKSETRHYVCVHSHTSTIRTLF